MKEKIKHLLASRKPLDIRRPGLTPAAVLIPLFCKENENYLLLTKRTQTVRHHKGQISFPGGVQDRGDESLVDTAKRETFEEIGVRPEHIEILGRLDQTITIVSNFVVTPFVGLIPYPYPILINPIEVEEVIELPLSLIFDTQNTSSEYFDYDGMSYQTECFNYGKHVIWGATARIIEIFRAALGKDFQGLNKCLE
jgi:8-oxo-dGTP pyrophosphatase MutT (NUDIX family)